MFNKIKRKMTSNNIAFRIATTYVCLLIVFFAVTVISYYLLPEGLLRSKHPLKNWDTSSILAISTLQIFFFNMLSVIAIVFGNVFLIRRSKEDCFMPLGYTVFFIMIAINAVTLGTWSFSVLTDAIPLMNRIIRTFDFVHRAGLWEMSGQLFILCATANISLLIRDGKEVTTKNWRTIKLTKQEIIVGATGIALMLIGAVIESYSIIHIA